MYDYQSDTLKILHYIPHYAPAWRYGGPIQSVSALCEALAAKGHEVHVYTTNVDGEQSLDMPTTHPVLRGGVYVHYFAGIERYGMVFSRSMVETIQRKIVSFDVIHASSMWQSLLWFTTSAAKKFSIPLILSPRGGLNDYAWQIRKWKHRLYWALVERRNYLNATALHFTAKLEQIQAERRGIYKTSFVVPNGIDVNAHSRDFYAGQAFRHRLQIPGNAQVILFLGRLHPIKGLDLLLSAFAKYLRTATSVHAAPVFLVIAGGDEHGYRADLEAMVRQLGIDSSVIFVGPVEGKQRTEAYSAADLFVLPSHNENFGMSAVEALAHELPIIVSEQVCIAPELLTDGAALVLPLEVDVWADAISMLSTNAELRNNLSSNGLYSARSRYDIRVIADQMTREYTSLILHNKSSVTPGI